MAGALAGVTVVELAIWAAAPAGGGIMADWGAVVGLQVPSPGWVRVRVRGINRRSDALPGDTAE